MSWSRLSLTARLTALYLLVSTLLLLGMAAVILPSVDRHFAELDQDALQDKIHLVQDTVRQSSSPTTLGARLDDALRHHPGLYVRIEDPQDQVLYENGAFSFPAELKTRQAVSPSQPPLTWRTATSEFRGQVALQALASPEAGQVRIFAALDTEHHAHFLAKLHRTLWVYVVVAVAVSGLLGWWTARAGLQPLRGMKAKAQAVTAHRLDQRIDADTLPVEMADLALTLNDMLQRLQNDFQRLSEFSSDLAHELRTPLNNLLTQTEVVLSRPRETDSYRDTLASNAEELQRLSRTVSDMLLLAKAEHGLLQLPSRVEIDLAQEVQALFDFYDALAESRNLKLELEGQASVKGDRLMLRRALNNLLSNALRHAPQGTTVTVRLGPSPSGVCISVSNEGPPIPQELLPRLFDRFYRADKARLHLDADGAGLGLSITLAIARAHGGTAHARSAAGQNVFAIDLPTGLG